MPLLTSPPSSLEAKLSSQTSGHWLPRDKNIILRWVRQKVKQSKARRDTINTNLQAFSDYVTNNQDLNALAELMWSQVPPSYDTDPTGHPEIRDFATFIQTVNTIIVTGPEFFESSDQTAMGLIGFPINAILDWPMGTTAGMTFWAEPEINSRFACVLQDFSAFLQSPDSQIILKAPPGWVGKQALDLLAAKGNDGKTSYSFTELYECPDPSNTETLGFQTWDQFFTRDFKKSPIMVRPIAEADNNSILNNGCESTPLRYAQNVKSDADFWLKTQPYSLRNMLNGNDSYVNQFVGGSVYQAFLSALSYHRWNSPVNGVVKDICLVPGTYFSENVFQGFPNPDGNAPNNSQPFISSVATRGIIYIEAEEPIGLMAIVYIGMAEVSSCDFCVTPGQSIKKGDLIGMFHFGGSSHCMVFRPGVELVFSEPPGAPSAGEANEYWPSEDFNLPVNSALAYVKSSNSK